MIQSIKKYPTTFFLLTLTSLVFLLMWVFYGATSETAPVLYQFGGMFGRAVILDPSQIWRLLTPAFVHIGWEHFFFNALTLYFLGQVAEDIWGSGRFLVIYCLSAIMGNALTLFLTPDVIAAGASTAIFGLFAAVISVAYFGNNPHLKQLGASYQILVIINLVLNLFTPSVSLVGHIGGLIGGLLSAGFIPNFVNSRSLPLLYKGLAALLYLLLLIVFLFPIILR